MVGDPKYLTDRPTPGGLEPLLHLHARSIVMPHPNGHMVSVMAPLPDHMDASFKVLGFDLATPIPEFEGTGA